MESMLLPLRRYAQFSGRSRRREFWLWAAFLVIASIVLGILDTALGLGGSSRAYSQAGSGAGFSAGANISGGWLSNIFVLATFIPSIAVAVRRLHDTGRTGWWILAPVVAYVIGFVLLFGGMLTGLAPGHVTGGPLLVIGGVFLLLGAVSAIAVFVFYCLPGTPGPNRFGDDPLGRSTEQLAATFD